jgi:hypothetical protein
MSESPTLPSLQAVARAVTDAAEAAPESESWTPAADFDALMRQVEEFELRAQLSPVEFDRYYDAEVELENQIIQYSMDCAGSLDFDHAREAMDQVIELNRVLGDRAEREIERLGADDSTYRERLERARDLAAGMILHQQGLVQQWTSDEAVLRGDIESAQHALASATEYYVELGQSSLPQNEVGGLRAVVAHTGVTFLVAVQAIQAGQYSTATDNFRRARTSYQVIIDDLGEPEPDEDNATLRSQFRADVSDRFTYARAMSSLAAFFDSVIRNDFVEAVRYAEDAVALGESWLDMALGSGATPGQLNVRRQDLGLFRGWLSWSRAELAIDMQDWDDCRRHLREAREAWESTTEIALRQAAQGVITGGATNGNNELLLRSTHYRADRERRLYEEITQLRKDAQAAAGVRLYAYNNANASAGVDMSSNSGNTSNYNLSGNFTGSAIGENARNRNEGPVTQNVASAADFRQLAEQLRTLADQLAGAARTPAEQAAASEIRAAESQARRGDRKAVLDHLRAAGRWALTIAEKLALNVAGDAIKQSLGVG